MTPRTRESDAYSDAWKLAVELDPNLPREAPDLPEEARRAIVGLARRVLELEEGWS